MADSVMKKSIAILGPGAIGGFMASVLWRAGHEVVCIAKPEVVSHIRAHGIAFKSGVFGSFVARPHAEEALDTEPDIIFITTKAIGLEDALERIPERRTKNAIIIPLLNGVEHMTMLRNRFGNRVIAGSIGIEAKQSHLGTVEHLTKHARIMIAADDVMLSKKIPDIILLFMDAGIEAQIGESEAQLLWEKLVRLNALACMTAATGKAIGAIRSDATMRRDLESLVGEASQVATLEGATIDPAMVMAQLDRLEATQFSSMQRDLAAGKETEVDAIAGAIVRAGARHGVACPTIAACIRKVTFS